MRPALSDRLRDIVGRRPAAPAVPVRGPSLDAQPAEASITPEPSAGGIAGGRVDAPVAPPDHPAEPGDGRLRHAAVTLGGRVVAHAGGLCVVVERAYGPAARHGRSEIARITGALREAREGLALIARAWPSARRFEGGLEDAGPRIASCAARASTSKVERRSRRLCSRTASSGRGSRSRAN